MKARGKRKAQEVNREQTGTPPPSGSNPRGQLLLAYPQSPWGGGFWREGLLFGPWLTFHPLQKGLGPSAWRKPQWAPVGPEPVRNLSEATREGALLALRTQARRKITSQAALSMLV